MKNSTTRWAVVRPGAKSLSAALGRYGDPDQNGLSLFQMSEITLFALRKDAKNASLEWDGSRIIPVVITERK